MATKVLNSTFTNCVVSCVYGYATDGRNLTPMITNCLFIGSTYAVDTDSRYGAVNATLANCRFIGSTNAVRMETYAGAGSKANVTLANNLFQAILGTAVSMYSTDPSSPQILNNIFKNCSTALSTANNLDCLVENNVFSDCQVAVKRTGTLSASVLYNCFFNNATNFIGYPAGFGTVCCVNRNGTSCDPLNNILVNPLFAETTNYTLATNSPCIDAGDGAGAYLDGCFPPSLGTTINDIGLYGGPQACGWIPSFNPSTFTVSAAQYCALGVTINPSTPGRYRLEYTSPLGNTNLWTQLTNVVLEATPFIYLDWDYPAVNGQRFYRAVLLP